MRWYLLAEAAASHIGKINKNGPMFLEEEKICYQMVYLTLHLDKANHQDSRWNVIISVGEKATFRKAV